MFVFRNSLVEGLLTQGCYFVSVLVWSNPDVFPSDTLSSIVDATVTLLQIDPPTVSLPSELFDMLERLWWKCDKGKVFFPHQPALTEATFSYIQREEQDHNDTLALPMALVSLWLSESEEGAFSGAVRQILDSHWLLPLAFTWLNEVTDEPRYIHAWVRLTQRLLLQAHNDLKSLEKIAAAVHAAEEAFLECARFSLTDTAEKGEARRMLSTVLLLIESDTQPELALSLKALLATKENAP